MAVYDDEKSGEENGAGAPRPKFNVTGLPQNRNVVPAQRQSGNGAVDRAGLKEGEEKPLYNPDGDRRSSNKNSDGSASTASSSGLKDSEESAGKSSDDSDDDDDSLFNPEADNGGFRKRIANLKFKKQIAIGASIVALFGGGAVGTLTVAQGPAQVVQLSEILRKPLSVTDHISSERVKDIMKYSRVRTSGSFGETRVGLVGSNMANELRTQLKDSGVTFNTNKLDNITSRVIDTSKVSAKYAEFDGANLKESQASAAEIWGGKPEDYKPIGMGANGEGYKLYNNTKGMGFSDLSAMINQHAAELADGGKITALQARYLKEYFGIPSIFHPYERAKGKAVNKVATVIDKKISESDRLKNKEFKVPAKAQAAIEDLKGKLNGKEAKLSNALLLSAGLCIVRSVADDVPAYNRAAIVEPSVVQVVDKTAAGDAIKSNNVGSISDPGATAESFVNDDGQSIWTSKPLKALTNPNTDEGIDLDPSYAQAFSITTTSSNMKKTLGGGLIGGAVCSPVGQFLQITASIALIVSGPFDGGTTTMAQVAAKAGAEGAETAATGAVISMLQKQVVQLLANKSVIPKVFSGAEGGGLYAYAARALQGSIGRSMGMPAASAATAADIQHKVDVASQQDFHNKSLKDRIFDKYDYRSLVAQVGQSMSPSFGRNITNIASSFTNIGGLFSHLSSLIMPHANAATAYDWGFPVYALPDDIINSDRFKDPYANADAAAQLLDGGNGNHYVDRAKACFGVNISKGDSGWQAVAKEDVNPNESDYIDAHCDDTADQDWDSIMLFVLDSRTLDSIDCYIGGTDSADQSCDNIGMGSTETASTPDTATEGDGTLASGESKDLAKQLLPFISDGKIVCGSAAGGDGPANCQDIQNTAKGTPIGGNCQVDSLTPHLLALILGLVKDDGWKLGISAICSNHHSEGDGAYAGHSYGSSADFSIQNGATGGSAAANKKFVDDAAALLSQTGGSFGQIQCHPSYPSISNGKFTVFNDACNHQHIRAAP